MSVMRWAAFIVLGVTTAVLWSGARSSLLVILLAVSLGVIFWSFGAFRRDAWVGDGEGEYSRLDEWDGLYDPSTDPHEVRMSERAERLGMPR